MTRWNVAGWTPPRFAVSLFWFWFPFSRHLWYLLNITCAAIGWTLGSTATIGLIAGLFPVTTTLQLGQCINGKVGPKLRILTGRESPSDVRMTPWWPLIDSLTPIFYVQNCWPNFPCRVKCCGSVCRGDGNILLLRHDVVVPLYRDRYTTDSLCRSTPVGVTYLADTLYRNTSI